VFWCLILHSFSIFVAERCRTKKLAVVGNGSHGRMWRRRPFWRQRRCVRVRKDGFVRRRSSTALSLRLLLKASGQVGAPMYGGPLFEILAVGGVEFADPRGTRSGSPHFGNLSIYLPIYLSIYLSKTLYRELGMVRSRQEFFNVSYQSI